MATEKKQTPTLTDFANTRVTLKPILGFAPRFYLKIIYSALLILLLFLLFLYPGIRHHGAKVTITSSPERASIYLDGKRVGSTPTTLFLPAGSHSLSLRKPYFDDIDETLEVTGRYFFTLFAPKKINFTSALSLNNLDDLLASSFAEASFAYSATLMAQFPREAFLLNALSDLMDSGIELNQEKIIRWASDSWSIIGDQASLDEVLTLWRILKNHGLPMDANLITGINFNLDNPSLEEIIRKQSELVLENNYFLPSYTNASPSVSLLGINFTHAPADYFTMGDPNQLSLKEFSSVVHLQEFYYTQNLISQGDFNRILANIPNPDDQSGVEFNRFDPAISNQSASYVSLASVQLFLSEVNRELMRLNLPWQARLPYESEWEYLIQKDLINLNYYEWMHEPYYPLKNLLFATRPTLHTEFKPFLHSVRGQDPQHIFSASSVYHMRGAQNPLWQSPYVSFRLILEPK